VSTEDIVDHGRRIAALERKISDLYRMLERAEPNTGGGGGQFGGGFDEPGEPAASVAAADDPRVLELVQSGDTIAAVKLYRELTGCNLAEARDAVQQLAASNAPIH
jgi:hypothetical protein